jgi:hypothetical protein
MPLWSDVDLALVEVTETASNRTKVSYQGGPLRFQIPRGYTKFGLSKYKSLTISNLPLKFLEWMERLEKLVSKNAQPLKSNITEYGLRIKVDESSLIFNSNSEFIQEQSVEGFLRDCDVNCIIDLESAYLWKGDWGISCKVYQLKFYPPVACIPQFSDDSDDTLAQCAFISSDGV